MKLPLTGGCSCGAIRYECTAKPAFSWNCHCRDCQRASGGGYCPVMYVPRAALRITGPAAVYYDVIAESGRLVQRGVCPSCGSNLFILAELVPELQGLWAGSLDDPTQFKPQINVWTRSTPWWSMFDPAMKKLDVAPNEAQFKELLDEAASLEQVE